MFLYIGFLSVCTVLHLKNLSVPREKRNATTRTLLRFSYLRNANAIFRLKASKNDLPVIHGLRALSTLCLIILHEIFLHLFLPLVNLMDISKVVIKKIRGIEENFLYQSLIYIFFLVDCIVGSYDTPHVFVFSRHIFGVEWILDCFHVFQAKTTKRQFQYLFFLCSSISQVITVRKLFENIFLYIYRSKLSLKLIT